MSSYATICLKRRMPQSLETLCYEIPKNLSGNVKKGSYVKVPLRNIEQEGVVLETLNKKPPYPTKNISELIYDHPVLQTWQIKLAQWIAGYYHAPIQKCLQLFLPPKFYSEDKIIDIERKKTQKNEKFKLTDEQKSALEKIIQTDKKFTLIHGITGSGKTEVYLHLVEKYIEQGKQSILVVPEISLTPQMVQYFENIFGDNVAILHSRLTQKERSLQWMKIFIKDTPIVIGPRSAVFAPVKNLGLIIMDEEHEFSYKQEQSPRYHTLSVIEKITELKDVKVILGSATPSVASYYRAKNDEYELVELNERIGGAKLPKVTLVDLRDEFKKKNYSILSEELQESITETLEAGKQTILFLNKRGSASAIVCRECGFMDKCDACDVPMTYHNYLPHQTTQKPSLICHHCGKIKDVPIICPECQSPSIKYVGAGTQKVEIEVKNMFPNARVARVDKDSIAKRGSFEKIYEQMKKGEIDILVGTQMISKGLHLPNVDLVGVILADIGIHFPDFRSAERTFQLLTQVAGRAGRAQTAGKVVVQTYMPDNAAIAFAQKHDFKNFYEFEIKQRKTFDYPPFSKLIKLTFVHEKAKNSFEEAQSVYNKIKDNIPEGYSINIYPALLYKLHNKYRWQILIQGEDPNKIIEGVKLGQNCRIDVDPISVS